MDELAVMPEPAATPEPVRRGWLPAFGLRWIFYLTTVAAIGAWFLQRPPYEVIGTLEGDDLQAVLAAIKNHPIIGPTIVTIEQISVYQTPSASNVTLMVDVEATSKDARYPSTVLRLEKSKNKWRVWRRYPYDDDAR